MHPKSLKDNNGGREEGARTKAATSADQEAAKVAELVVTSLSLSIHPSIHERMKKGERNDVRGQSSTLPSFSLVARGIACRIHLTGPCGGFLNITDLRACVELCAVDAMPTGCPDPADEPCAFVTYSFSERLCHLDGAHTCTSFVRASRGDALYRVSRPSGGAQRAAAPVSPGWANYVRQTGRQPGYCGREIRTRGASGTSASPVHVPLPVWSYWDGRTTPTVALASQTWRRYLDPSHYSIRSLNAQSLRSVLPAGATLCGNASWSRAIQSDIVRLWLLYEHGGLFMDSSVLLAANIDDLLGIASGGGGGVSRALIGFFNERNMRGSCARPVIETSFLAAPPRHRLVREWLAELIAAVNGSFPGGEGGGAEAPPPCTTGRISEWHAKARASLPPTRNLDPRYHIAYFALQRVLVRAKGGIYAFDDVQLLSDAHHLFMPLTYLNSHAGMDGEGGEGSAGGGASRGGAAAHAPWRRPYERHADGAHRGDYDATLPACASLERVGRVLKVTHLERRRTDHLLQSGRFRPDSLLGWLVNPEHDAFYPYPRRADAVRCVRSRHGNLDGVCSACMHFRPASVASLSSS
jgi:hypothetical protein